MAKFQNHGTRLKSRQSFIHRNYKLHTLNMYHHKLIMYNIALKFYLKAHKYTCIKIRHLKVQLHVSKNLYHAFLTFVNYKNHNIHMKHINLSNCPPYFISKISNCMVMSPKKEISQSINTKITGEVIHGVKILE